MRKISNFIIASNIIRYACNARHTAFVDMPVEFSIEGEDKEGCINGVIFVKNPKNIIHTSYLIVKTYFDSFNDICGIPLWDTEDQKEKTLLFVFSYLKSLSAEKGEDSPVVQRLYQDPFVWILMKDIICPVYQVKLDNVKMVSFKSPFFETNYFNNESDPPAPDNEESFVFVNTDIVDEPCKKAILFISALKAYGLNPKETLSDIFESGIKDKLNNAALVAFKDDKDAENFMRYLYTYSGVQNFSDVFVSGAKVAEEYDKMVKESQSQANPSGMGSDSLTGSWYYMGLLEKLLEPSRGPDWSTHFRCAPFMQEIYDKIEVARSKQGRAGASYEMLLRAKDGEVDPKTVAILEKTLSSDRVW